MYVVATSGKALIRKSLHPETFLFPQALLYSLLSVQWHVITIG